MSSGARIASVDDSTSRSLEKNYAIAVEMYKLEHTRWHAWTLFYVGGLAGAFVAYNYAHSRLRFSTILFVCFVLSFFWMCSMLSIRRTSFGWFQTILELERCPTRDPFSAFSHWQKQFTVWKDGFMPILFKSEGGSATTSVTLGLLVLSIFAMSGFLLLFFFELSWGVIGGGLVWLISTLAGAAIALGGKLAYDRHTAPDLEISFDSDHGGRVFVDSGFNFRLLIRNAGRSSAKRCMGYLDDVSQMTVENTFLNVKYNDIMPLKWAYECAAVPIEIPRDVRAHLDVFIVKPEKCYVPWKTTSDRYSDLFNQPTIYRLTIRVAGENLNSKTCKLEVDVRDQKNPIAKLVEVR